MLEKLEKSVREILNAALESVHAGNLVQKDISLKGNILHFRDYKINLNKHRRIFVIGAGKASVEMGEAFENILADRITGGLIITKYKYGKKLKYIKVREGGHPVVDQSSLNATDELLDITSELNKEDLVFVLISGGGSALLEKYTEGIKLKDAQKLSQSLLDSGVKIKQMNLVRQKISQVKSGGLGRHLAPAKVFSLILSDVVSDRLDLIASGPTMPGAGTCEGAIRILKRYKIWDKTGDSIKKHLNDGAKSEAQKKNNRIHTEYPHVTNLLLGSNNDALLAAQKKAAEIGYNTMILTSQAQGEAKDVASFVSSIVNEIVRFDRPLKSPACVIIGGETTVTVSGDGIGGRNMEFALSTAIHIRHLDHNVLVASIGTDGNDGITDSAGAMVNQYTFDKGMSIGLNPRDFLKRNDSYSFFSEVGGVLKTGPTGTNVMDIILVLVQ